MTIKDFSNQLQIPDRGTQEYEKRRVEELARYRIVDSEPEEDFDRLVALTSRVFGAPLACVSLVSDERIWFKSKLGFDATEVPRHGAFCNATVNSGGSFVILDATQDPKFAQNPLVTGDLSVRFYAGAPLISPAGLPIGTLCILDHRPRGSFSDSELQSLRDLTNMIMDRVELRYAKIAKRDIEQRFYRVAVSLGEGVVCADTEGMVTFWNPGAEACFGYTANEIIGRPFDELLMTGANVGGACSLTNLSRQRLQEPGGYLVELEGCRKTGENFTLEACYSGWPDGDDFHYTVIMRDISVRKREEEKIHFLAKHDPLTGLANRIHLRERLRQATMRAKRDRTQMAVLLIDLDNFKEINDTLGHACGDKILFDVAKRLKECAPADSLVARLSGDEFAIVLDNLKDPGEAREVSNRITTKLAKSPFISCDKQFYIDGSIGVAIFPSDGDSVDELLANADLALYRAKEMARGNHVFYCPEIRNSLERRRNLETELRRAVAEKEFELFYQPQVRLSDCAVVGAEALIRWNHPQRGLLAPAQFLKVLNGGVLADEVGQWVLEEACKQARSWHDAGYPLRMGVNLSPSQFRNSDLAVMVDQTLDKTRLSPDMLELEVTENILLGHDDRTAQILGRIRDIGVSIAFDDFGTGYASLSHLKRFPLDRLKIDRSFIRGIAVDPEDATIVKAIISLGKLLGLSVIAEGIEKSDQISLLQEQGCNEVQGYYYGRPMPSELFEEFISTSGHCLVPEVHDQRTVA